MSVLRAHANSSPARSVIMGHMMLPRVLRTLALERQKRAR